MAIHLQISVQRARRIAGVVLVATYAAAIFTPAQAGSAATAQPPAAFFTVSSPLEDTDLDHVRGHGVLGTLTPGSDMRVGVILWDEYRRPQPTQGGGTSSIGSSAVLPSGATAVTITTISR